MSQSTAARRPAPGTRAALNNQQALTFDGTDDYLDSDDAAATWAFLHDGTGYTAVTVFEEISTSGTPKPLWATCNSFAGTDTGALNAVYYGVGTGFDVHMVLNGSGTRVLNQQPGALNVNLAAHWTQTSFKSSATPNGEVRFENVSRLTGPQAVAPVAAAPTLTLRMGALVGAASYAGIAISEIIFCSDVLASADNANLAAYFNARYAQAW